MYAPPEVTLGKQKVQPPRQASNLRLQIVPGIDKRRSSFTEGHLDEQFSGAELGLFLRSTNIGDTFEQRDGLVLDKRMSVSIQPTVGQPSETNPILQNLIESTNNPSPIPPLRWLDRLRTDTRTGTTTALDLRDRSESTSRESLFEFRRDRMIRVEIGVECREEDSSVSISAGFGGDVAWWWGEAVDVVDVPTSNC